MTVQGLGSETVFNSHDRVVSKQEPVLGGEIGCSVRDLFQLLALGVCVGLVIR